MTIQKSTCSIEPFGLNFIRLCKRISLGRGIKEDEELQEAFQEVANINTKFMSRYKSSNNILIIICQALQSDTKDSDDFGYDDNESPKLLKSDPLEWKKQDHYAVLGLTGRYKATDDDIKRAYRKKVLKHHPDKTASSNKLQNKKNSDSFFKCIQKAWEILSDQTKRRQWDSCDPQFSDAIPSVKNPGDFFEVYGPVFEREARFCTHPPVPSIGTLNSTRSEVESFYNFWFKFESWRTFEMLDEEDVDKADSYIYFHIPVTPDSRDEKRYYDKLNKSARQKRKKEDNARLIRLCEQAYKLDPRLLMFKKQEREEKEAKKKEKQDAIDKEIADKKRAIEEAEALIKKTADEERQQGMAAKKERDAKKKAFKKLSKAVMKLIQDQNYFLENISNAQFALHVGLLTRLIESFGDDYDQLMKFKEELEVEGKGKEVYNEKCLSLPFYNSNSVEDPIPLEEEEIVNTERVEWCVKDTLLLHKAVQKHPGGTVDRWNVIASYVNAHTKSGIVRTGDECVDWYAKQGTLKGEIVRDVVGGWKSKGFKEAGDQGTLRDDGYYTHIQLNDNILDVSENKSAKNESSTTAEKGVTKKRNDEETVQTNETTEKCGDITRTVNEKPSIEDDIWTSEQTTALINALKTYPPSLFTADPSKRWIEIAKHVPGKTKKQVKQKVLSMVKK